MRINRIRKYKKRRRIADFRRVKANSAIWLGVCLPFAIATAISLKNALAITFEFFTVNLFSVLIVALFAGKAPYSIKIIVSAGTATIAMVFTRALITYMMPDITNFLGTYVYLMALSGVMLLHTGSAGIGVERDKTLKLWPAMTRLLLHMLTFAGLMLVVSLPREYFGNGTLWGKTIPAPIKLPGMQLPFFGFILVASILALTRFIIKKADTIGFISFIRREAEERARYRAIRVDMPSDPTAGSGKGIN